MNQDLPAGWASVPLGELAASIQYGYTAAAKPRDDEGPALLRITDIQDGVVDWSTVPSCDIDQSDLEKFRLSPGDILFARTGATTGKSFLVRECPQDAVFASYLIRARLRNGIDPAFLSYYLRTPEYWSFISDNVSGNAQPNCNASKLSALQVPIPPAAEQRRIVKKVDELLARADSAREHLAKVVKIRHRFRRAVLASACSGQLTEDWRNAGEEWSSIKLADAIDSLDQGWSPKCDIEPSQSPNVWGVIKTTAVQPLWFDERENKRLPSDLPPRPALEVKSGDVLITRAGPRARAGITCLVRGVRPRLLICDKVYRIRARTSVINAEFLNLVLNAPSILDEIEAMKTGISDSGVNLTQGKLLDLEISLPSIAEQQEIVRRVHRLFDLVDIVESRERRASAGAERLTQSILAKAFRGELVATEAELAQGQSRYDETTNGSLTRHNGTGGKRPRRSRRY